MINQNFIRMSKWKIKIENRFCIGIKCKLTVAYEYIFPYTKYKLSLVGIPLGLSYAYFNLNSLYVIDSCWNK